MLVFIKKILVKVIKKRQMPHSLAFVLFVYNKKNIKQVLPCLVNLCDSHEYCFYQPHQNPRTFHTYLRATKELKPIIHFFLFFQPQKPHSNTPPQKTIRWANSAVLKCLHSTLHQFATAHFHRNKIVQ